MHYTLGNPLMIEMEDLLTKMKIFEQCGPTRPDAQRVLIVRDGSALLSC